MQFPLEPHTAEDERKALAWLETSLRVSPFQEDLVRLRMLKVMLAQPRLPHPESLTAKQLEAMWRGVANWDHVHDALRSAYRVLYDDLTKPKTKTVWDVEVSGLPKQRSERQEHIFVIREFGDKHEIMVTPRQVPAD